jgi:hypothetical protein
MHEHPRPDQEQQDEHILTEDSENEPSPEQQDPESGPAADEG